MKDERHVRQRRAAGARWRPAAILLAAVLVFLSLPLAGKASEVINLDTKCSLTIAPGPASMEAELALSDLQIELYKVADAIPVQGYDTYGWEKTEPTPFGSVTIPKMNENANAAWRKAAQQAAEAVLGTPREGETEWNPSTSVKKIQKDYPNLYMGTKGLEHGADSTNTVTPGSVLAQFTNLEPGLYLILAHGESVTDYAAVRETADSETADGETEKNTVTLAHVGNMEYTFLPELVSLPNRPATNDDPESGPFNTANRANWVYNAKVTLKPSQRPFVGGLKIVKTLDAYEQRENGENLTNDDAAFIFEVTVTENDASEPVYHDMVSITFDANSTVSEKSVLIEGLPVGSQAVVKEIYPEPDSGEGLYKLVVEDGTQTITADTAVSASFENDYNDQNNGGGSVTNKFTYKEGASDIESRWGWEQVSDDSETGVVIQSDSQE